MDTLKIFTRPLSTLNWTYLSSLPNQNKVLFDVRKKNRTYTDSYKTFNQNMTTDVTLTKIVELRYGLHISVFLL